MAKNKKNKPLLGRFQSIRSAMLVPFTLIVLTALLIFMLIAMNYTSTTVLENARIYTSQLVNQVNYDIDSYIDYMANIATMITESEDVQTYFYGEDVDGSVQESTKQRILDQFRTIMDSRADISNIAITTVDNKSLVNQGTDQINDTVDIQALDWYQAAFDNPDGMALSTSHVQNAIKSSYQWVITLSKVLTKAQTNEKLGVFFIDLNYSSISDLCNNNKIGNRGYIFILDKDGNIIYHPQQQLMYGGLKSEYTEAIMDTPEQFFQIKDGNDTRLYTKSISEKTGWTVVGMSYTSELMRNSGETQLLYAVIAAVLLLMVVLVSSWVARAITRPVAQLRDSMEHVEHGEFHEANVDVMVNNEIGSLSKSFNVMTDQIQRLMEQNVYEQRQKRKSEIRALQAQINPHFLYNTLDSIIWMAEGGKNQEVVRMTSALARLLRQSISNENEMVSIGQEIDYVQNYLSIQKMRYKDKLEYKIDVDPVIKYVPIIKLVLQPLVENAIYHGLKYKEGMGHLTIRGYEKEDTVCIEIQDDGIGMSQEEIDHIFDQRKVNRSRNGVGVYNVQQRLQLHYGESYGLTYTSSPGVGTTARITVPVNGGDDSESEA